MKVPVDWLREFVDVPADPAALKAFCDGLTMAGLEVEEILPGPTLFTKVIPNRGDWASVYGTAREAAAVDPSLSLRLLPPAPLDGPGEAARRVGVTIEDARSCPRYVAAVVRGVRVGPTPAWMAERLSAALGEKYRPINNVVDVTNYVLLELGQPLHAFDLATIPDGQIVVRPARPGETLVTLDGEERALTAGMLCICDRTRPIALAGILGGAETEIGAETVDILLESAHFDPVSIRRTAKALGLATEASYRFERFVDPEMAPVAAWRAAHLLVEVAGGEIVGGLVDVYARRYPKRRVLARMDRVRRLLGVEVGREEAIAALERLGVAVERSAGALDCVAPSWRPDLAIEEDIVEEIGRIAWGFGNLPETLPPVTSGPGRDSARGRFLGQVRDALARAGLQEVVTHSLVAPETAWTEAERATRVRIRNPMAPQASALRTSLWPNLCAIAARASAAGQRDLALFEVGPVYARAERGYREPLQFAGLLAGSALPGVWGVRPETLPADFYAAKGAVDALLHALGIADALYAPASHPLLHPYRTASVAAGDALLGVVGELSEASVAAHDLPRRTCVFALDGDALFARAGDVRVDLSALSRFPASTRDLAPVFGLDVPYASIEAAAREAAGEFLESLRLVDVYDGAHLGAGRRALTLRFTFRAPDRTLTEEEIEASLARVRAALAARGGELRG